MSHSWRSPPPPPPPPPPPSLLLYLFFLLLPLHVTIAFDPSQCLNQSYPRSTPEDSNQETVEFGFIGTIYKNTHLRLPSVGALFYGMKKPMQNIPANNNASFRLAARLCNTDDNLFNSVRHTSQLCLERRVKLLVSVDYECKTQATIAAAYNMPMIGVNCNDPALSDKSRFPTFTRVNPQAGAIALPLIALLQHYSWSKIAFISPTKATYQRVSQVLMDSFEKHNITVLKSAQYDLPYDHPKARPSIPGLTSTSFEEIVDRTYLQVRIYVVLGFRSDSLGLLHCMDKRGLLAKGKYFVVGVDKEPQEMNKEWLEMYHVKGFYFSKHTYNAYLHVSLRPENEENRFIIYQMKVYSIWHLRQPPFNFTKHDANSLQLPSIFKTASLVDAILLYKTTLANMQNYSRDAWSDGRLISEMMRGHIYRGALGYISRINEYGDSEGNYTVYRIVPQSSNSRRVRRNVVKPEFKNYGVFMMSEKVSGVPTFKILNSEPKWRWNGGAPPRDEPRCGFRNERCQTSNTRLKVAMVALGVFACIILTIAIFVYRNHRFQQELDMLLWKIDYKELALISAAQIFSRANSGESAIEEEGETTSNNTQPFQEGIPEQKDVIAALEENEALLNSNSASSINSGSAASLFHMAGYADLEFGKTYAPIATYRKQVVVVKRISKHSINVNKAIKKDLKLLRDITNQTTQNLTKFLGACVDDGNICTVWEYCERGSLQDILYNEQLSLEPMFISSLTCDLLNGLAFLHYSDVRYHGNLKSSNCVVDGRWALKLTDFGVGELKHGENLNHLDEGTYFYQLFWTAPELLRFYVCHRSPHQLDRHLQVLLQCLDSETVERHASEVIAADFANMARADIYALGIVLYELYSRKRPYFPLTDSPLETVRRVIVLNDEFHVPYRPKLSHLSMVDKTITDCIETCWDEQPFLRPSIKQVRSRLKDNVLTKNRNIFDNMMMLMETYAKNLERLVNERTGQLIEEKKRTEELLYQMLPVPVAEQLKRNKKVEAEAFDSVTIYFSDIVGFTELSADSTPFEVVQLLNDLYTTCDSIIAHYQVYKVETIGDAYMVVSGVPRRNSRHAGEIADMSIQMLREINSSFSIRHRPGDRLKLRVGINSGACCAGVVGTKMPRFCLFGDTVNMASRMETSGEACRIHISEMCKNELDALGGYIVNDRGEISVKGRGQTRTFWLCGRILPNGEMFAIDGCDNSHPHLNAVAKPPPPKTLKTPHSGAATHQKSPRSGKSPNFITRNFMPSGKLRSKGSGKNKQETFPVFRGKNSTSQHRGHLNEICAVEGPSV